MEECFPDVWELPDGWRLGVPPDVCRRMTGLLDPFIGVTAVSDTWPLNRSCKAAASIGFPPARIYKTVKDVT